MQILKPLGNLISEKVKNWKEIEQEANELHKFIKEGEFDGHFDKCWALAHCQVSREPKRFFIVNEKLEKSFGHWCVINLKILKGKNKIEHKEGCMSFMFRDPKWVKRFSSVVVTYWTPLFNTFLIPHIRIFQTKKLEKAGDPLIEALVCQHEDDHFNGKNIYGI